MDTATCNYAPPRRESMHWLSLLLSLFRIVTSLSKIVTKFTDGVDGLNRDKLEHNLTCIR